MRQPRHVMLATLCTILALSASTPAGGQPAGADEQMGAWRIASGTDAPSVYTIEKRNQPVAAMMFCLEGVPLLALYTEHSGHEQIRHRFSDEMLVSYEVDGQAKRVAEDETWRPGSPSSMLYVLAAPAGEDLLRELRGGHQLVVHLRGLTLETINERGVLEFSLRGSTKALGTLGCT